MPSQLIVFMDDVSGNVLKQWNKHHAIYMSNANVPCEMLEKEFFVRFLMRAMKESICVAAESGIVAWDCKDRDNPMQAEECSHAGLNCNYYCRMCDVGGTKEYKESEAGYSSIFNSGNIRTPEAIETAMLSGASEKVKNSMSSTGICDTASASILNTLLELGKKLRKHTVGSPAIPENEVRITLEKEFEQLLQGGKLDDRSMSIWIRLTEILHTILLGVVKYFWGQTVFLLEKSKLLHLFQTPLETINKDGLNAPCLNANYICNYKGSLIGKHFKSLAQVMPFLIYNLVPPTVLNGWTVMGELVVLVWHTKIANTEVYLVTLQYLVNNTIHFIIS
ncbi:hypothetical protein DFJ58DRAFT_719191 [Suillus subalutaceus]|uniref:uncharacterized protein n=1 Tax=Suillus subalutaceus TaxID=48586 RepID=UPI001B8672D0|nr:uncharacterized protein DFJ58DRAFT_719191 [Suillus subalutaceus]KAG1836044.1 hypothetical protein DFJ58DRAFT_719191 [Suillus subalutaceus]